MPAALREIRDPDELKEAAGHVVYEVVTLLDASHFVGVSMTSPASEPTSNIALESYLIHYRNLRDFLCPDLKVLHPSDVIASDYLDLENPAEFGSRTILEVDKLRINKLLAHITYERAQFEKDGNKSWPVAEMTERIADGFDAVLNSDLTNERRAWFREVAEALSDWRNSR